MSDEVESWILHKAAESHRRIRELEAELAEAHRQVNVATALGSLLSKELEQARARIAELEHVERVATDLMTHLAKDLGAVLSPDDAARILARALKKKR